jgi:esterase/lipase superfamily enzyme
MSERAIWGLDIPGFDRSGTVIRYGHYGRPVVVFPSE